MKIELIDKNSFFVFINRLYLKDCDFSSKEEITSVVKKLIFKLKDRLHLRGFYKIKVYVHDKIGLFLDIIQLDDLSYSGALELRIIVFFDCQFLFEVDDYFLIHQANKIWYLDNRYYCLVDDLLDSFYSVLEFGRFLYGEDALFVLHRACLL